MALMKQRYQVLEKEEKNFLSLFHRYANSFYHYVAWWRHQKERNKEEIDTNKNWLTISLAR